MNDVNLNSLDYDYGVTMKLQRCLGRRRRAPYIALYGAPGCAGHLPTFLRRNGNVLTTTATMFMTVPPRQGSDD